MIKIGVPDLLIFIIFFSVGLIGAPTVSLQYISIGVHKYKENITLVLECYKQHPKNDTCAEIDEEVESGLSSLQMIINIMKGVIGPIVIFILGGISDGIGRKFPIIVIIVLNFVWSLFVVANTLFPLSYPPYLLALQNGFILGLSGGSAFTINTFIVSYVSVTTNPQKRTERFSTLMAVGLLGYIIGPILSGLILSKTDDYYILGIMSSSLMLIDLLIAIFVLKKVTDEEVVEEIKSQETRLGKFTTAIRFQYENTKDMIRHQSNITIFVGSIFMYMLTTVGFSTPLVIICSVYVLGAPFNWNTSLRGYFTAGVVLVLALQAGLTVRVLQWLKFTRPAIVRVGIFFGFIGSFFLAFAESAYVLLIGVAISTFVVVASPALQSMTLSLVEDRQTGAAMGLIGAVHTIAEAGLLNLVLFVYNHTRSIMNGFCFFTVSFFLGIDLVIAMFYQHPQISYEDGRQTDTTHDDMTIPIIPSSDVLKGGVPKPSTSDRIDEKPIEPFEE